MTDFHRGFIAGVVSLVALVALLGSCQWIAAVIQGLMAMIKYG